jgi:hypothetical protein
LTDVDLIIPYHLKRSLLDEYKNEDLCMYFLLPVLPSKLALLTPLGSSKLHAISEAPSKFARCIRTPLKEAPCTKTNILMFVVLL